MSNAERDARREKILPELRGLDMGNTHDPADCLVDLAFAMYEADRVKYIAW